MDYNKKGEELPDAKPVALPIHFNRPQSLNDRIRQLIQNEVSRVANETGQESFDEANDFNTGEEDSDPLSNAEKAFMAAEAMEEARAELEALGAEGAAKLKDLLDGHHDTPRTHQDDPEPPQTSQSDITPPPVSSPPLPYTRGPKFMAPKRAQKQ